MPGRTATPALGEGSTTSASSRSPRSIQAKLACDSAVAKPELAQRLLDEDALDQVPLDPERDIVLVADRLGRGGLGERVDAERLADGVDRRPELRRAERVADPQPGQPVALAEGAQQDEVRDAGRAGRGSRPGRRWSGTRCRPRPRSPSSVRGNALHEGRRFARAGRWVPVGLFGLQTISSWVAAVTSSSIASRSWT